MYKDIALLTGGGRVLSMSSSWYVLTTGGLTGDTEANVFGSTCLFCNSGGGGGNSSSGGDTVF